MSFLYDLPTTGAAVFNDFLTDPTGGYAPRIASASASRARLRAVLKECRRTDEVARDWSGAVKAVEDYLPHLLGVMKGVENDVFLLKGEPVFSWRSTLSSHLLRSSPRLSLPSMHYELASCLLTLGLALSNTATSIITSLGPYERIRETSDQTRKANDERMNTAAQVLCQASGVFSYLSETTIPNWESAAAGPSLVKGRPPELTREVTAALAKLAMADAGNLAIRKLLSRAIMDSITSPGPPLPRSHPSPSLLAKLYLNVHTLYEESRGLAKSVGSTSESSSGVDGDFRKYLTDGRTFSGALGYKWLGVDAGENGSKLGEALGWLGLAKEGVTELATKNGVMGKGTKERGKRKGTLEDEVVSVEAFIKSYTQLNRTVSFEPITPTATLLARVPGGKAALAAKPYHLPQPTFGHFPSSQPDSGDGNATVETAPEYALQQSYF